MEMRTGSLLFPSARGSGPRTALAPVVFPRQVVTATAGLAGYGAGYDGDDHHVGRLDIRLDTAVEANVVTVTGTFGLRDWSGTWDDNYRGTVGFVVLADLVSAAEPPPRGDVFVTGMETTQAIQAFRSAAFLDAPNVRPDNSIPLIARKDTGVRVYVDYDADAGLPPIGRLSGELVVSTSIGSTTFTLAPVASIVPRADASIDRRQVDHTLNFVIPEGWCQGELTVTCRVFDAAAPASRSAAFTRTLRFEDVEPLRVFAVGVDYTGQGLNLPAPTQVAAAGTLGFVEVTYPVPEALLTGYTTIPFDVDMKADIADGCGDGFGELLDRLRDMRGSSSDVYYGFLPPGIDTGSVGGCGGGGVGAGFVGGGSTAAQEIGHAFGRDHAPCDSATRCGNPSDEDDDFPTYASFPSDSIGEVGYNPRTNRVFDPATSFDFMGYSSPSWVSPYTYLGLKGAFPSTTGFGPSAARMLRLHSGPGGDGERPEWIRRDMMTLHLRLVIDRDRTVTRLASFHYPVADPWSSGRPTGFTAEILGEGGRVLSCAPLREACTHCDPGCWPKHIRTSLPFPDGAARLVIREGDEVLTEEDIPAAPDVEVRCRADAAAGEHVVTWKASEDADLWYLVQYEEPDGTWRGAAPRTRETEMRIPWRLLGRRRSVRIRVLATSGLATGVGECTVERAEPETGNPGIVVLEPVGPATVVTVAVLDGRGSTVSDPEVAWYDEGGREIGRGRSLDVASLPPGAEVVYAVSEGSAEAQIRLERDEAGRCTGCRVLEPATDRDVHTHGKTPSTRKTR